MYGLAPPDDDLALADAFVASLDGADRELAYAAVLLACRFVGRRSRSWRVFDVASFACMELGACFEGTLEERSAVFAILEGFFAWQSARGELSERELTVVRRTSRPRARPSKRPRTTCSTATSSTPRPASLSRTSSPAASPRRRTARGCPRR
ncbi:MAG: hypothetical protein M5U28_45525 [Sandaracinaceae bacterium]|nr:hypothetical protein [Sandaracinaceae bacterium]